jgi:hypothetical protein
VTDDPDDADGDGSPRVEPQKSISPPLDAWVTVRVDGTQITRFSVDAGEEITIHLEQRDDSE